MARSRWLPFEEARAIVAAQGFNDLREFEQWAERPASIPSRPRDVYRSEWVGARYWLGKGPPNERPAGKRVPPLQFEEARTFARRIASELGLKNQQDWQRWAKTPSKPANIPADPAYVYKDKGWTRWPDWLGREAARAGGNEVVRSFLDARAFARSLGLKSSDAWYDWAGKPGLPSDIPYSPDTRYRDEGWIGWGDFLGFHSRWTHRGIVAFLDSLKPVVAELGELELYLILSRNGMLRRDRRLRGGSLLRGMSQAKTPGDIDAAREQLAEELSAEQVDQENDAEPDADVEDLPESIPGNLEDVPESRLTPLRSLDDLKAIDQVVEARITEDPELLDFMVENRVSALWQEVMAASELAALIGRVRAQEGGVYLQAVRDRFLKEYDAAAAIPLPEGYAFRDEVGQPIEPNPMQRLTAYRLQTEKQLGNWSGVGAGKTNAAILAAGVLNAQLTVVLGANATLDEGWRDSVLNMFPAAAVHVKDPFGFHRQPGRHNFLVLNYESFQQKWSERFVREFTARERIDLLVLDEVQYARQRKPGEEARSRRRELVEALVAERPRGTRSYEYLGCRRRPS